MMKKALSMADYSTWRVVQGGLWHGSANYCLIMDIKISFSQIMKISK